MNKTKLKILISLSLIMVVAITLMINNNITAHASDMTPDKVVLHGYYEDCFSPDTAYVTMGVMEEKRDDTISEVSTLEYSPTNLDMVLSTLENNGIDRESVSTMEIDMPYDMFENMRANTQRVTNVVEFKTNDIANLENIISSVSNNASVKNVRYSIENTNTNYSTILNGAIDNATAKLNSLIDGGNYRVAEVIEEGCYSPCQYSTFANINGEITSDSCISMCGNVRVVFEKVGE